MNEVKQRDCCLFVQKQLYVRLVITGGGAASQGVVLTPVSSNEVKARAYLDSLDK